MDFSKEKIVNYFLYDTQVENLFAAEYMLDAPGDYVKVYLLALAHAQMENPVDTAFLAKQLKLSTAQVEAAWDYWVSKGVVKRLGNGAGASCQIRFVNLKEAVFGSCAVAYNPKPDYNPIPVVDDGELKALYGDIERICGRLLEAKEAEAVAVWISELGMDSDIIRTGYRYCTEKAKSNRFRYVEKVLLSWREKNLTSVEQIEEYLSDTDKQYELHRKIFAKLGFRRIPTDPERSVMNKWFGEMNLSPEDVFAAIEKTTGIANPNIKYLDAVLTSEYNKKKQDESDRKFVKIQDIYAEIREANEKQHQRLEKEIYSKIPRMKDISSELKDCGLKIVKAMLAHNFEEIDEFEKKQKALSEEKNRLLADFGYGPEALEPIYTCKICKDTGFTEDGAYCRCYGEKMRSI